MAVLCVRYVEPAQRGRQWTYGRPRKEKFKRHPLNPECFDVWLLVVKRNVGILADAAHLQLAP